MQDYQQQTDGALIRRLRQGDGRIMDYLLDKYKPLVRKNANSLYLIGGDTDDLIQEGMIGLFKAIRDYDEVSGSFFSFAELCIRRQMYTAIQAAARKKHIPLNSYVSLSGEDADQEETMDLPAGFLSDPEQQLIDRENGEVFLAEIKKHLSAMERAVLYDYLEGMNYRQIARKMGRSEKSIDNALQRIRAKVQALISG